VANAAYVLSFLWTGSDAKSVPIQVLVDGVFVPRGQHPNGYRGGYHE
jgi:hypothetical protein